MPSRLLRFSEVRPRFRYAGLLAAAFVTILLVALARLVAMPPVASWILVHAASLPFLVAWLVVFLNKPLSERALAIQVARSNLYYVLVGLAYLAIGRLVIGTETSYLAPLFWPSLLVFDVGCVGEWWPCWDA